MGNVGNAFTINNQGATTTQWWIFQRSYNGSRAIRICSFRTSHNSKNTPDKAKRFASFKENKLGKVVEIWAGTTLGWSNQTARFTREEDGQKPLLCQYHNFLLLPPGEVLLLKRLSFQTNLAPARSIGQFCIQKRAPSIHYSDCKGTHRQTDQIENNTHQNTAKTNMAGSGVGKSKRKRERREEEERGGGGSEGRRKREEEEERERGGRRKREEEEERGGGRQAIGACRCEMKGSLIRVGLNTCWAWNQLSISGMCYIHTAPIPQTAPSFNSQGSRAMDTTSWLQTNTCFFEWNAFNWTIQNRVPSTHI